MHQPVVPTHGQYKMEIYTVQNRGRAVCQFSFSKSGHRQHQIHGKLSDAHREAKVVLGRLAVNTKTPNENSPLDRETGGVLPEHIVTFQSIAACSELHPGPNRSVLGTPNGNFLP